MIHVIRNVINNLHCRYFSSEYLFLLPFEAELFYLQQIDRHSQVWNEISPLFCVFSKTIETFWNLCEVVFQDVPVMS